MENTLNFLKIIFMPLISALYIYPIKSLAGISVNQAELKTRGLQHDRRWMLINKKGRALTQRQLPKMAQLQPEYDPAGWKIIDKTTSASSVLVPWEPKSNDSMQVNIWGDKVEGHFVSKEVDDWFSNTLDKEVSLVYMQEGTNRLVDQDFAKQNEIVSFADGYPVLLISEASLSDFNTKLDIDIEMRRFRPNIVISGTEAYAEDQWKSFEIAGINFQVAKPCARCSVPGIDPDTSISQQKILDALKQYRSDGPKTYFGQNLLYQQSGLLKVGDELNQIQ